MRKKLIMLGASAAWLAVAAVVGWLLRPDRPVFKANSVDRTVTQVLVRAGHFISGIQVNNRRAGQLSLPPRETWMDAFWISRTQVTNAQYLYCVEQGACVQPLNANWNPHFFDPNYAEHPVVFVTWYDAQNYCSWLGGRLPTELEWEKAARGPDGRTFAWGEDDPEMYSFANVNNIRLSTVPVGSYPHNASPYGVLDMGSNVREWVDDWYTDEELLVAPLAPKEGQAKVLRGASWLDSGQFSMVFNRWMHSPGSPGQNRGFRCVFMP